MLLAVFIAVTMQFHSVAAARDKFAHTSFDAVAVNVSHSSSHAGHGALQPEQMDQTRLQLAEATHQNTSQTVSNCCMNGGSCPCNALGRSHQDYIGNMCTAMQNKQIVKQDQLDGSNCGKHAGYVSPQMIACILRSNKCIRCSAAEVANICNGSIVACPSAVMLLTLLMALVLVTGKDEP
eukprot:CAMPEP_0172858296 /NCGR_PEP_ID=MMETSP1075-20121228/66293_1 /TAXON_ID=2916 /ORGANISM="Ceratium fusus, Strain PA161109" /LENGTH=179 /DNA_ID=CAMNT_0013705803 /DNA_START=78 /DNA_END=617 /DNA_ORIENTATION=+